MDEGRFGRLSDVDWLAPKCNTAAMSHFLLELLAFWPDERLLLFLNGAGRHRPRRLPVPERLRLEFLPPYSPECNPTEHIWDEVRENGFANQLFSDLAAVEVRLETTLACSFMTASTSVVSPASLG